MRKHIELYKNGKLVDYGTKNNVAFYVRMGYTVRVLNDYEVKEKESHHKVKEIWLNLPTVLKKRVSFIMRNTKLDWQSRLKAIVNVVQAIVKRVATFTCTHRLSSKDTWIARKIKAVWEFIKALFTTITAAQLQLGGNNNVL